MNNAAVLDYLRRLDGRFDGLDQRLDELVSRVGGLERGQADLRLDVAEVHVALTGVSLRLDHLDGRVRRIEQRLNLLDAAAGRTP